MIVRPTVTTKALIPVDRVPIWNRYEGGPIFTTVDQKNKDNLLRTAVTSFIPDKSWMRPSDGEKGTETTKTSTRSPNDRRTTIRN